MNPWLEIPLEDYEGHMAMPAIGQAQFLAETLGALVQFLSPHSVAVIGCAGGNGFEQLPPDRVRRVAGVDINPDYIAAAQKRFQGRFKELELHCVDLLSTRCAFAPVDLVFAGLLFEYIDFKAGLSKIKQFLNPGGILGVVLQLPNAGIPSVTPSRFKSLEKLGGLMKLVAPDAFEACAASFGFTTRSSGRTTLGSGKAFHEFVFNLPRIRPDNARCTP